MENDKTNRKEISLELTIALYTVTVKTIRLLVTNH